YAGPPWPPVPSITVRARENVSTHIFYVSHPAARVHRIASARSSLRNVESFSASRSCAAAARANLPNTLDAPARSLLRNSGKKDPTAAPLRFVLRGPSSAG